LTEIKKKDREGDWKTTKDVAKGLGVSNLTINRFYNNNKQLFEGLVSYSSEEYEGKTRKHRIWSSEAVKTLALNISNPKIDQWKEDVIDEVTEKGIIIAQTDDINIIEQQWKIIGNLIQAKKRQDKKIHNLTTEQHAMQKELANHSKLIERHEKHIKDSESFDEVIKTIRDYIQDIYETRGRSIWAELHNQFHFSKLDRITVEKGKLIISYIQKKYYHHP